LGENVRTIPIGILVSFIAVGSALPQSLGEVAKKEKERRQGVEKASTVVDEEALSKGGSRTVIMESTVTSGSENGGATSGAPPAPAKRARSASKATSGTPEVGQAETCWAQVQDLHKSKKRIEDTLAAGFPVREDHPRMRRRTSVYEPMPMGWEYRTNTVTCEQAESDPRYQEVLPECRRLKKELAELERQIPRQTSLCQAGRAPSRNR
jgi:hypothetical protein